MTGAPKLVLLGMMTKMPVAGVVWQTVHYLVGFQRLGFDVYYVEAHARTPSMFMEDKEDDGSRRAAAFIDGVMRRFDLGDHWALHALHADGRCYGMTEHELKRLYASAELLVNLHGGTQPLADHAATGRLVYLETDPVQLQIELHDDLQETVDFLEPHVAFFTFAENLGAPDCKLPVPEGFDFKPTRQPVVLDCWRAGGGAPRDVFTTVGNWKQPWRDVSLDGETYSWSKHHEFLKFLDLPERTGQAFELAVGRCGRDDRQLLEQRGWRVREPARLSSDVDLYRSYIQSSRGEFTVAKDQNVRLRTGWFSDRSATYLAAGRPVITQDTAFSNVLPVGEGLHAFSTIDDAVKALEEVNANYERHSAAARAIASERFSADRVLINLMGHVGLAPPRGRQRHRHAAVVQDVRATAEPRLPLRVMLVSHRFPPDAVAGVERYTEAVAAGLRRAGDEVNIVTRRPGVPPQVPTIGREELADGTNVYRLTGGDIRRDQFLVEHERLEDLFETVVIDTAPEVVHINHIIDLSPRMIEIARRHGAAVVMTLHDYYFACQRITLRKVSGELCAGPDGGRECARTCFASNNGPEDLRWGLRTAYFRRLLAVPDRVICPSDYVASYFREFATDGSTLVVLPNGVWIEPLETSLDARLTPKQRGTLTLAFVGAVLPHKGVHVIIDALRLAGLPSVDLTLLGPADDAGYVRALRDQADAVQGLRLRLYGAYEPSELPLLLDDIDCVIAPSQWAETFGLMVREALVRGIPVVASRLGALPEPIVEGENGFTFQFDDTNELATILRRLHADAALLPRLRKGARETGVPSMREHVRALRSIYWDALEQRADEDAVTTAETSELDFLADALIEDGSAGIRRKRRRAVATGARP